MVLRRGEGERGGVGKEERRRGGKQGRKGGGGEGGSGRTRCFPFQRWAKRSWASRQWWGRRVCPKERRKELAAREGGKKRKRSSASSSNSLDCPREHVPNPTRQRTPRRGLKGQSECLDLDVLASEDLVRLSPGLFGERRELETELLGDGRDGGREVSLGGGDGGGEGDAVIHEQDHLLGEGVDYDGETGVRVNFGRLVALFDKTITESFLWRSPFDPPLITSIAWVVVTIAC